MIPAGNYVFVSFALLLIGVVGVVARRNVLMVLMSIELILNAVNINLVAFSRLYGSVEGQAFALFLVADAAAEAAIALAIVFAVIRRQTANIEDMDLLKW